jgi:hypothetical protein
MKKYITLTATLGICSYITLSSFMLKTAGMHPSSTGAPGDLGSCANASTGCHSNATVTNDNTNIVNTLIYSAADSSYVPGQTYTLTLKAQKSGIVKFGFGMVALRTSNNSNQGTWVVTDAARTHTVTGTGTLSTRKYMTHSTNGTPAVSAGLGQWSFNWKAPATNVGNIKFYYATNCTNNNNDETGDQLYLSSFTIHPFVSTTSVANWINEEDLFVSANPANQELVVNYQLKRECQLSLQLFDLQGKRLAQTEPLYKFAGANSDRLSLTDVTPGIYMVSVNINGALLTKKVLVQ